MEPFVPFSVVSQLANNLSSAFVQRLINAYKGDHGKRKSESDVRLITALADLIGITIRALEVAALTDQALVELSMLTDVSEDRTPIPPNLAIRLRANLERLINERIETSLRAFLDEERVAVRDSISKPSISDLIDRYTALRRGLQSVLDALVHGRPEAALEAGSLTRSLTELSYLSRTLARAILVTVEGSLRVHASSDVDTL